MASLRNTKLELLAQALAAGKDTYEANTAAGFDPSASSFRSNARKRVQRVDVKSRVLELQALIAKAAVLNAVDLIVESEEARVKAMREKGGASAAVSAIVCKAKLAGLWRDKVALTDPTGQNNALAPLVGLLREIDGSSRGLPAAEGVPG